jgi:predicted phosphohydrolase
MKFYLLSDLHLECKRFNLTNPDKCDALILAGDIGNIHTKIYKTFLKSASQLFKYTFIIKGNHECYGYSIDETDTIIKMHCSKYNNVYYLNQYVMDIDNDIRIIGTTLWSNIEMTQEKDIANCLNDFKLIKNWNVKTHNIQHIIEKQFIKIEINKAKIENKKILIITHHSPTHNKTSSPEYEDSNLTTAFSSNLDYLFSEKMIWCYGHTHFSNSQIIQNTKLLSNQRGYPREETKFNIAFTFEL